MDKFNGCLEMLKRLFVKYGPKQPALKRMSSSDEKIYTDYFI